MEIKQLIEELEKFLMDEVSDEWKQQKRTNFINNKINTSQEYLKDVNNRINSYGKQSYTDRDYNTVKRLEKDRDREAQNLKYFNTKLKSFDRGQELYNNKPIPEKTFEDLYGKDWTGKTFEGNIDCSGMGLTSLKGCPKVVNGYFNCYNNHLTSLEYAPEEVSGYFDCRRNNIKTLSAEDFPKIGGIVYSDFEEFNAISGKRLNEELNKHVYSAKSKYGRPITEALKRSINISFQFKLFPEEDRLELSDSEFTYNAKHLFINELVFDWSNTSEVIDGIETVLFDWIDEGHYDGRPNDDLYPSCTVEVTDFNIKDYSGTAKVIFSLDDVVD